MPLQGQNTQGWSIMNTQFAIFFSARPVTISGGRPVRLGPRRWPPLLRLEAQVGPSHASQERQGPQGGALLQLQRPHQQLRAEHLEGPRAGRRVQGQEEEDPHLDAGEEEALAEKLAQPVA